MLCNFFCTIHYFFVLFWFLLYFFSYLLYVPFVQGDNVYIKFLTMVFCTLHLSFPLYVCFYCALCSSFQLLFSFSSFVMWFGNFIVILKIVFVFFIASSVWFQLLIFLSFYIILFHYKFFTCFCLHLLHFCWILIL